MWLTLATFVGYAVIYTVILKPATPQNIVIGGASGAMPPVLGWAAVTGDVTFQPLLLFLIIFAWTPPHFWALALYRRKEYERAGVPMLPVTHGEAFTRLHLLLYTVLMVATTLLPFATGMAGWLLPGRGAGARRGVPRVRRGDLASLQRRARAADVRLFDLLPRDAVRGAHGRPLPAARVRVRLRAALAAALAVATLGLAACDKIFAPARSPFDGIDVTGARHGRGAQAHRPQRQAAHRSRISAARSSWCSSATRSAPTSARPRSRTWQGHEAAGRRCQARAGALRDGRSEARHPGAARASTCPRSIPTFLGLYGDEAATAKASKEFQDLCAGAARARHRSTYTMDHSAQHLRVSTAKASSAAARPRARRPRRWPRTLRLLLNS